jgi:hypothetical protein
MVPDFNKALQAYAVKAHQGATKFHAINPGNSMHERSCVMVVIIEQQL